MAEADEIKSPNSDESQTTASVSDLPSSSSTQPRRWVRGTIRFLLMVVLPVLGILYGAGIWAESLQFVNTENAYVKSHVLAVSSDVSGRVIEINARDNQPIKKGDVLFRIDPQPFQLLVNSKAAEFEKLRLEIDGKRLAYKAGLRAVEETREALRYMKQEYDRAVELTKRGVGTTAKRDAAKHQLEMARRQLRTREENNRTLLAELGGNPKRKAEQDPEYFRLSADFAMAKLNLERTTIRAATDGVPSNVKLRLGEYVRAGSPVFAMVESGATWIEANLKETQLTHLIIGQTASVKADSYPDARYQAVVESIAPATGAEFALLPPQNASGNWVKVVQRIPIRLRITDAEEKPTLRAGMTVTIDIDTKRQRSLKRVIFDELETSATRAYIPEFLMIWLKTE